ncbi:MAG TPA: FUSC family protein [Edaphobacter sp.]|nr:FUSC family protein [Edaphobacter sp.]
MSTAAIKKGATRGEHRSYHLGFARWPAGTTALAFEIWLALAVAYYVAFVLELNSAAGVGTGLLILVGPTQGMVLSKAIYRIAGTLFGALIALILTSLFSQDRTMLIAVFSVYMACLVALATLLRDFRAYGCILAGYTVALISIADVDAPTATFTAMLDRVAVILLAVLVLAFVSAIFATAESVRLLQSKLRLATKDIVAMTLATLDQRVPPDPSQCVAMSATLMPLRSEIGFATPELLDGWARAKGARSALLGLFEAISAIQALGLGLRNMSAASSTVEDAISIVRAAIVAQRPEKRLADIDVLTQQALEAGVLSIEEAYVLDRCKFMIEVFRDIRDGLLSNRVGRLPRRSVSLPVHQDYIAAVLNGLRVGLAVDIVGLLAVLSGLPGANLMILGTIVFVSLGSVMHDPLAMGRAALVMTPAVIITGTIYDFLIFPNISDYPLFIISLAPVVTMTCWLIKTGKGPMGIFYGVQSISLLSPANVQQLDPTAFVDTVAFLVAGSACIFVSLLLIVPVNPALRRLRLALAVGRTLRRALADENRLNQPRASLLYDRLSQFSSWQQHGEAVTPARRNVMRRLSDLGNLSFAVRRSWRALDQARIVIDPAIDAKAREILPTLSPMEILDLSRTYLAAAAGLERSKRLDLVHAAAALYGTAVLTTSEIRLLRHLKLLRYQL